jgi:hypothetical protein
VVILFFKVWTEVQQLGHTLKKEWNDVIGTLKATNGTIAVLGCSHFAATYKKEVFEQLPQGNSIYKVDCDSEFLFTDEPVLKMGGYR